MRRDIELVTEADARVRILVDDGTQIVPHDAAAAVATLQKARRKIVPEHRHDRQTADQASITTSEILVVMVTPR